MNASKFFSKFKSKSKCDELKKGFKETVNVISSDPPCKDDIARVTTVPLKPLSDQNSGRFNVFLNQKVFIFLSFFVVFINKTHAQVTFGDSPQINI